MLSWNLFHGRSVPPAGRELLEQFAGSLAAWDWDVALLQEVPPWWPGRLASASGAEQRTALTSRNSLLALRRALAERWPDAVKSSGGGANAILAREPIAAHLRLRLRSWPERRVAQLVRLADGSCLANYHGSTRVPLARDELARLWQAAAAWAAGAPLVLGGDLNLRDPQAPAGAVHVARRDVDHIFARPAPASATSSATLERSVTLAGGATVELSDHPPLLARL